MKKKFVVFGLLSLVFATAYAAVTSFSINPVLPIASTDTVIVVATQDATKVINPATNGRYIAILYNSSGFQGTASPTAAPTMEEVMVTGITRNNVSVLRAQGGTTALNANLQFVWKLAASVAGTSTPTFTPTSTFTPTDTFTPTPTFTPTNTATPTPRTGQIFVFYDKGTVGATSGWVVGAADDAGAQYTLPASQTSSTLKIPCTALHAGDRIQKFFITGGATSAGNGVTLTANLRALSAASGGISDASIASGSITVSGNTKFDSANTLFTGAATITQGTQYYMLITGSNGASTAVTLNGVGLLIDQY